MRALLALAITACASDAVDSRGYECRIRRTCGPHNLITSEIYFGTEAEIFDQAAQALAECSVKTEQDSFSCDVVLCAAICTPEKS